MSDALERRCGSCARFVRVVEDVTADGRPVRRGECLLGVWPSPLFETSTCSQWVRRGEFKAKPEPTRRRPISIERRGLPEDLLTMDAEEFRRVLSQVIREELGLGDIELAGKWEGGEMILKPGKPGMKEKTIPLDSLFHKVVMIRDRLRVLEQKINSHGGLADDEKVQLQQYVTACYGSLTTFNVLFSRKEDQFIGAKTESED